MLSIHLSCSVTVLINSNVGTSNSDNRPVMFNGPKFCDVSLCHSVASLMKQVWLLYRESWMVLGITPLGVAFEVVAAFDFAFWGDDSLEDNCVSAFLAAFLLFWDRIIGAIWVAVCLSIFGLSGVLFARQFSIGINLSAYIICTTLLIMFLLAIMLLSELLLLFLLKLRWQAASCYASKHIMVVYKELVIYWYC